MANDQAKGPVRFPPPLIFLGLLLIGFAAELLIPLRSLGLGRELRVILGAPLFLAGLLVAQLAIGRFRRADTPPEPWLAPRRMVVHGIYRRTRNPMYLGMALIYAGLAIGFDGPIALLLMPVVILTVQTQVIAREEAYLEARFGDEYRDYKASVRRWL